MRFFGLVVSNLLIAAWGFGQHTLYVEHAGQLHPVRAAKEARAMIDVEGHLIPASGLNFSLQPADEFFPVMVYVKNLDVETSYKQIARTSDAVNSRFRFEADFFSPYQLEDAFMVLVLQFEDESTALFLYEIGRLDAYRSRHFERSWPVSKVIRGGKFDLHLFAAGKEIFHSLQDSRLRELMFDRMIAKRVAGVQDAAAKPFFGPTPGYPPALIKSKVAGEASVKFRIAPNGAVVEPKPIKSSDPAFGEAAVTALRQWRFLPQVKDGHAIESEAQMPFGFKPPPGGAAKP